MENNNCWRNTKMIVHVRKTIPVASEKGVEVIKPIVYEGNEIQDALAIAKVVSKMYGSADVVQPDTMSVLFDCNDGDCVQCFS
jgi:hypothetical protein